MQVFKPVFVLCLLLAGCSSPAKSRVAPVQDDGTEGAKIYIRNCGKCHEFYSPSKYTQPEWDKWMAKMRRKSKLKSADFDEVLQFTEKLRNAEPERTKAK
jgi:mono/diheme cytochrome c family protein